MRLRNVVATIGLLVLASCSDQRPPLGPSADGGPQALSIPGAVSSLAGTLNLLTQSLTAPPLQTYNLTFWAVQGQSRSTQLNYQPNPLGQVLPFLALHIPRGTQLILPDGTPVAPGDSVEISLTVDPLLFKVHFEPHGLEFSGSSPARLAFYYGLANLDLDGNGVINWLDELIEKQQLGLVYQADDSSPWSAVPDQAKSITLNVIAAQLRHFSNYAVSW